MRTDGQGVSIDVPAILGSDEARAAWTALRDGLELPAMISAAWSLMAHRPIEGEQDRYVPTYTVHMGVDRLGIMPDAYLAHDGDLTPEFDLRSLFLAVRRRAKAVDWRARVEVVYNLVGGLLLDVSVRLPTEGLGGTWEALIDDPPPGAALHSAAEIRRLSRQRRRITVRGTFERPSDIPIRDVRSHVGVIVPAMVDTPLEIEAGWPLGVNLARYEWEE